MIDKKPFRMKNEAVKNWAKTTYEVPKDASIQDICFSVAFIAAHELASDLLDARELIDKQEALIKEMRRTIYTLYMECEMYEVEINLCKDILEKTKDYA